MHSLNHILPQDQAKALEQPLQWPFANITFTSFSAMAARYTGGNEYENRMGMIRRAMRWNMHRLSGSN